MGAYVILVWKAITKTQLVLLVARHALQTPFQTLQVFLLQIANVTWDLPVRMVARVMLVIQTFTRTQ
jgi:hypothetical protein